MDISKTVRDHVGRTTKYVDTFVLFFPILSDLWLMHRFSGDLENQGYESLDIP